MTKNFKKAIVSALCGAMVLGLVACGNNGADPTATPAASNTSTPVPTKAASTEKRTADIYIGTWWTQHYDSADTDVSDSADWAVAQEKETDTDEEKENKRINRESMTARFENVKKVEERYGVKYYWQNLTYAGVEDSINNSILAGSPDCDIYLVSASIGIPAQMNGLCVDLKTVLPADHDLFTTQTVAKYLDLGDGKACIIQRQGGMNNNAPLGYNKALLDAAGLEDPNALWERGEWTWDKFREYCKKLTQDNDGDGVPEQYGFAAWDSDQFEGFMLSNGASIASGTTQQLTSARMTEVLQFIYDLHNVDKVCYPATSDMDSNDVRTLYKQGNIGFFRMDVWIQEQGTSDYDWGNGGANPNIDFDVIFCHWPLGYSAEDEQDTVPFMNSVDGELYIIPAGVQDPETVFNVLYDSWNWYEGDVEKRDNPAQLNWWIDASGNRAETRQINYKIQQEQLSRKTIDLWNTLSVSFNLWELLDGTVTPSQWQETYAPAFQDGIDNAFGNK